MMLERGKNQKPEDGSKKEMGPRAHLEEPVFVTRRMIILCMYVHMHINTHTHHYTTVTGIRSSRLFMDPYYLIDLDQNPNRILTHTGILNLSSSISKFASFPPHVSTFRPWHLIFSSYPAGALLSLFLTLSSL